MNHGRLLCLFMLVLLLCGCAAKRPVLYPNGHYRTMGEERAQQDIDACIKLADAAGADGDKGAELAEKTGKSAVIGGATGAVSGAISGSLGKGSLIGVAVGGTVGLVSGAFGNADPSPVYMRFVEYCLMEKGYQPIGWK